MSLEYDKIEKLNNGDSLQHGKFNDRIYLMKRGIATSSESALKLKEVAQKKSYSKIFAKVTNEDLPMFIHEGYSIEGFIPKYFEGKTDLFILCYYLTEERSQEKLKLDYDKILKLALSKAKEKKEINLKEDEIIRLCIKEDILKMVSIYSEVFPSYPFPIHDPDYLLETMEDNVDYYCIEKNNKIVALSSSEIDFVSKSSEMTDFATLPEFRGASFASQLLEIMEKETKKKGIKTFYTIARAISPGMNITFTRKDYIYGGRLKNNTNISGNIESMNIWYKNV